MPCVCLLVLAFNWRDAARATAKGLKLKRVPPGLMKVSMACYFTPFSELIKSNCSHRREYDSKIVLYN